MSRLSPLAAALALLAASVGSQTTAIGAPIYSVTDIGHLYGTALNNVGQVVGNGLGSAYGAPPGGGGFLYDGYGPNAGTV
jgi:hypothetical protein